MHVVPRSTVVELGRDEVKKKITKMIMLHLLWDTFMCVGIFTIWIKFKSQRDETKENPRTKADYDTTAVELAQCGFAVLLPFIIAKALLLAYSRRMRTLLYKTRNKVVNGI